MVGTTFGDPVTSAINGDADGFQFVAAGVLHHLAGGVITTGDAVDGTPWSAPGSATVLVSPSADTLTTWRFATDGVLGADAVTPFVISVDCDACPADGSPCACQPHDVQFIPPRPDPTTSRLALVMADVDDGYAVLTLRALDLPLVTAP